MAETKGWMIWEQRMRDDIDLVRKLSFRVGSAPSKVMMEAIVLMGISEPKTKEEMYDCFHQMRAVVNYMENKLDWLHKELEWLAKYRAAAVAAREKESSDGR
jgi:hypothetical protein